MEAKPAQNQKAENAPKSASKEGQNREGTPRRSNNRRRRYYHNKPKAGGENKQA